MERREPHGVKTDPHLGAVETQVDMKDIIPQRINRQGDKVEDAAGSGEHDSKGG